MTLDTSLDATVPTAEIVREYGPFPGADGVHGVSYDGRCIWAALGTALVAVDPHSGDVVRTLERACRAGTAYDGRHLYQIHGTRIDKIDPQTGEVCASIPTPGPDNSGLAWAEGSLWLGQWSERRILQLDPQTGRVLRTIESDRYVTGVTWVDGELWHGTWEGEASDLRRVDPATGEVVERVQMPAGTGVSGLEADGNGLFYCGGGPSGMVRAVRRPQRRRA